MRRIAGISLALIASLLITGSALAAERDDVERVVAVGDVHGDYEQFFAVLQEADVIDRRGRWTGGETHLVQMGDVPDRGPDTDKIIDLLKKLQRQAKKAGGEVHAMIGNHETMVMRGDLRYVHPGEYAALTDRRSKKRQDDYYEGTVAYIKANTPEEEWPAFDESYREQWQRQFPLGYVEHRLAWTADGMFGGWVAEHDAVVRINDSLFVHGGIDPGQPLLPLAQINDAVRTELADAPRSDDESIINAADGPLWYRGLAVMPETPENEALLDAMLEHYGVRRVVIAHTPLVGTVMPRFGGKVILADVGLSAYYGGARASLVIDADGPHVIQEGRRFELPAAAEGVDGIVSYLRAMATMMPKPERVERYIEKLTASDTPQ